MSWVCGGVEVRGCEVRVVVLLIVSAHEYNKMTGLLRCPKSDTLNEIIWQEENVVLHCRLLMGEGGGANKRTMEPLTEESVLK